MAEPTHASRRGRTRATVVTTFGFFFVWAVLVSPGLVHLPSPVVLARIPLEGLGFAVLAVLLGPRARRSVALLFGVALGLVAVLTALNLGFHAVLDRPFDPVNDWAYLGPAVGVLDDSSGGLAAVAAVAAVATLTAVLLVALPLCALRVAHVVARHRTATLRTVGVLAAVWVGCALVGVDLAPGVRVASTNTARLAYAQVGHLRADLRDRSAFARAIATDSRHRSSAGRLLGGLHGHDVLFVFVESYGRVAVQGSSFSPAIDDVLDVGTRQLRSAGFSARSAFLTSPTFGAGSWLAHSTLQSGLWVDTQQRYDQLLASRRLTLTEVFGRAGWRTVFDDPAVTHDWPEGRSFYHFDQLYDAGNVGYRGPAFSYAPMPDQYTLAAFRRRELAADHRPPVMAEIDLISSHHPWAPLPHLVPANEVGDGSVFDGMPQQGASPDVVFRDPGAVRAAYARSIRYSLRSLVSFLRASADPDLVVVMLGDHQPHSYVTGGGAGHDVPVTVLARDPEVLGRIGPWGWQPGLRPGPGAPVWRMDTFRDRFLDAFSTLPGEDSPAAAEPDAAPPRVLARH